MDPWWRAALIHAFLVYLSGSAVSAAPPAVGLRGYRRFHANDSHIGTPLPCTYEEKLCFRFNTLFDPQGGRCLPSPVDFCQFTGDKQKFMHGSGNLIATCPGYKDPCNDGKYRMAYDGRCYRKETVRDVICGCAAEPTPHFLGGVECRCSPATRIHVEQPKAKGRCRIPDLRFPDNERSFLYANSERLPDLVMQCTAGQAACFSKEMVQVRGKGGGCHRIHQRGPCSRDHVVVLDRKAALSQRAEATCVHVRGGCPPGQKRMAFDGKCHEDRELHVITYGNVQMLEDGQFVMNSPGTFTNFLLAARQQPKNRRSWECTLTHSERGVLGAQHYSVPSCGSDDKGHCHLFEVEATAPLPEFD